MDSSNLNNSFPPAPAPHKSWFSLHYTLAYIIVAALFVGAVAWVYVMQKADNVDTSTPVHQTNNVNMTDWKTYTNTQYGFQFQYPQTLVSDERNIPNDYIVSIRKNGSLDYLYAVFAKEDTSDSVVKGIKANYSTAVISDIRVGGISSIKIITPNSVSVIIPRTGGVIQFTTTSDSPEFSQVISTFKFTK